MRNLPATRVVGNIHRHQGRLLPHSNTSTRPPILGCRCTRPVFGGSRPTCIPTSYHIGQSGGQVLQENHSDCSRVAQHALVLGSSGHVKLDPCVPDQPTNTSFQPDSPQTSFKPKSACLAPKASGVKEQGFSEALQHKLRRLEEAQPDQSMRQSGPFSHSGATVIRWTSGHHL